MGTITVNPHSIPLKKRVSGHKEVRKAHASEISEDYVEAIYELEQKFGRARVVEIAKVLGVTHVTVIRTIERLKKSGLVSSEPYKEVKLTEAGAKLAERAKRKHEIVLNFLLALGIDEATAIRDAEGIEHHVSKATLDAFESFNKN